MRINSKLEACDITSQKKAFYMQRIPESNFTRKKLLAKFSF